MSTERAVLERVVMFQKEFPLGAISFTELSGSVGVTCERVRQIYRTLESTHTLPPVRVGNHQELSEKYLTQLDASVAESLGHNVDINAIAKSLSVPRKWVMQARSRLVASEREKLMAEVERRRTQGFGTTAIAESLGFTLAQVQYAVGKLVEEGRVKKLRDRTSKDKIPVFDAKVKELREEDELMLTYEEIAGALEISTDHILSSVKRLLARGEIKSRSPTRSPKRKFYSTTSSPSKLISSDGRFSDAAGVSKEKSARILL